VRDNSGGTLGPLSGCAVGAGTWKHNAGGSDKQDQFALMLSETMLLTECNGAQTVIASNDNWAGDAQLAATSNSVGAFSVTDASSKDAMLLITLAPGNYTTQASGAANTGGLALVEVDELP